jgi:uncharacterized protein YbbK (DUF523 family)
MKIVSACLAGINCRYNGTSKPNSYIIELVKNGQAIPVCPEQLGGLPTPRTPAEQQLDRSVVTKDGKDVTEAFKRGAQEVLDLAQRVNCDEAILKAYSPSCGCGEVYDGSFSGKLVKGYGILAELLMKNGIKVKTELEI